MTASSSFPKYSALSVLGVKENGVGEVQSRQTEDFTLTIISKTIRKDCYHVFGNLSTVCDDLPTDINFRPTDGTCVAVDTTDGWQRGYILSVLDEDSYYVALCDSCCVQYVESKQLKALPSQFLTIPTFGVKAKVVGDVPQATAAQIQAGVRFKYQIIKTDGKSPTVILTSINITSQIISCRVILTPWIPKYEDRGLRCVKLKNKCKVKIISYCSQHDIYLCPMDDDNVDLRNNVIQDVVAYCEDAPDMERLPDPGELVACRFTSDEIYYRALVMACDKERVQVSYVDFGNVECVAMDRLKPLTDELKQIPCTAVHVSLTNVRQGPLTLPAIQFIDLIIMCDSDLKVNFTDTYINGVTLISDGNENINAIIDNLLTPVWKQDLENGNDGTDNVPLTVEEHVHYIDMPEKETFELFVLNVNKNSRIDFYGVAIDDLSIYGLKSLPKETARYCEEVHMESYTPRVNELCLAMYNNEWLRAVCLRIEQIGCAVYFQDWGNTEIVPTRLIRRMPIDFIDLPALANRCFIAGLPENLPDDLLNRLVELIPRYSVHTVKVNSKNGEYYYLDMPNIIRTLQEEGCLGRDSDAQ